MTGRSGSGSASGSRLAALVGVARPVNGFIAAAAVLVGAVVGGKPVALVGLLLGGGAAFLIAGGANAYNDFVDAEADRVNRPGRPIPSGRLDRRRALPAAAVAYAAGGVLAALAGLWELILAAAWIVLTVAYSRSWQGVPFVGNVVVALVAASACVMGGISQDALVPSLVPFGLAFLAHLAREILKDVEDAEGDRAAGRTTAAVRFGARSILGAARGVTAALMVAAVAPAVAGLYGRPYAALLIVVEVLLGWAVVMTLRPNTADSAGRAATVLKWAMVAGLVGIGWGSLAP